MATSVNNKCKAFTSLEQSKKLAEILPLESADMYLDDSDTGGRSHTIHIGKSIAIERNFLSYKLGRQICAWSLAALLSLIKDKCGYFEFVYLKRTYDGMATPLEDVYRLSTDVYDVYKKEALDACYEMILKLNELNLL